MPPRAPVERQAKDELCLTPCGEGESRSTHPVSRVRAGQKSAKPEEVERAQQNLPGVSCPDSPTRNAGQARQPTSSPKRNG